jgi:hypothetical protein
VAESQQEAFIINIKGGRREKLRGVFSEENKIRLVYSQKT